jgi:UDP-N-acetylglucosamine 1-carboxyvinyltransferase
MGLKYNSSQGAAKIEKSCLYRASVTSPDLRGGMALIIAALSAKGRSEILSPEIILRGYDNLIEKLESLGANIKLVNL